MKTAREYRSLAWDQLRANFKQSSIVVLVALLVGVIAFSSIFASVFYMLQSPSWVSGMIAAAVMSLMLLTTGLLGYYRPVWFMSMVRKQPERWYDIRTPYMRALIASVFVIIPNALSGLVNGMSQFVQHTDSISPTIKLILALLIFGASLVVLAFTLWYGYSISIMLPLKVYDREERSVFGLIKETFQMMKGHRWQLFCVDFFIVVWPIIVIWFLSLVLGVVVGLHTANLIDGNAFLGAVVVTSVFLGAVFLVYLFLIAPMVHFAHALFYEDLQEELKGEN